MFSEHCGNSALRHARTPAILVLASLLVVLAGASCHRRPAPPHPYLAFVANQASNTVAVVDLASLRVVASILVAAGPSQLVLRPRSQEVWVVSRSGVLSVIEYPALRLTKTEHVGSEAGPLVFSPDGHWCFLLARENRSSAARVLFGDARTGRLLGGSCCGPGDYRFVSLASTPDGKTLIAADAASNQLVFIAAASHEVLGKVSVGEGPGPLEILPDSGKVFVADTSENKISAVDIASRQLLSNIEIGSRPSLLALKPDGGELFVGSEEASMVTIVDTFHDYVEESFPSGSHPAAAVFREDSSLMYLANAGDGSVMAYDIQNRQLLNSTHAGARPVALALTPDERFLVAADAATSNLAVLRADPAERDGKGNPYLAPDRSALVTTVSVGAEPVSVVIPDQRPAK